MSSDLAGWDLSWFCLRATGHGQEELAALTDEVVRVVIEDFAGRMPADDATVQAVRRLFRDAGCDPTRYRPSSEALIRRVLKERALPRIHPLVDVNNLLSLRLRVPCCVIDPDNVEPPFTLRSGRGSEDMESLRGPFNLDGKPVLVDARGPFGTPITDSERVKITADSHVGWLVAYGVVGVCGRSEVAVDLAAILGSAPVAEVLA